MPTKVDRPPATLTASELARIKKAGRTIEGLAAVLIYVARGLEGEEAELGDGLEDVALAISREGTAIGAILSGDFEGFE